jgi:hypothetical protein
MVMDAWGRMPRLVPLALVMSQLQRTSPVVLLARVQDALLNATPGIEVAIASEGDWGTYVPVGSVGASEHEARMIVRALLSTTRVIRNISQLAFRGRIKP